MVELYLFFLWFCFVPPIVLIIVFSIIFFVKEDNKRQAEKIKAQKEAKEAQEREKANKSRLEQLILQADNSDSLPAKKLLANEAQRMGFSPEAVEDIRKKMYERLNSENES